MNKKKLVAGIALVMLLVTAPVIEVKALSTAAAAGIGVGAGVVGGIVLYKVIKRCRNRRCCRTGDCSCRACRRNQCYQESCGCGCYQPRLQPNCGCRCQETCYAVDQVQQVDYGCNSCGCQ